MAIGASPRLAVLLLLMHLVAMLAVWLTVMPLPARLVVLIVISASLYFHLARDALLLFSDSWRGLSLARDGLRVTLKHGGDFAAALAGGIFVSPHFIVLRLIPEGRSGVVSRIIFADAMTADDYRALCVRLRFGWSG